MHTPKKKMQKALDEVHAERVREHESHKKENNIIASAPVIAVKEKKHFEKGYTQKWDPKILEIVEVLDTTPKTYKLSDGRTAYAEELQMLDNDKVRVLTQKTSENKPRKVMTRSQTKKKEETEQPRRVATRSQTKKYPSMVTN